MKSINKLFGIFMALCLLLGGAACTDEVEYTGAELQNANQPYFPTNLASKIDLSADATSFTVEVSRLATGTELTVDLVKSGDDAGLFTVPATATFAADAMTAAITIGYDPAKFELDVYNPLTITIATEGLDNPYSSNTYSFTAGIPAPYETIGEATFADAGYFTDTFFKVELQQNSVDASLYRLVNPYATVLKALNVASSAAQSPYLTFKLLKPGDVVGDVTISSTGLVLFEDCNTGYTHPTYGEDLYLLHPSRFTGNFQNEAMWTYNKVVSYKEDGSPAIVQLAPYYFLMGQSGGWNYTQADGAITIVFPDVVITDYSVSMSYEGSFTDPNGANYVLANVNLGTDVFEARLALVSANTDVESAVAGIIDGSIETTNVRENGQVQLLSAGNGTYYLVAVTYSRDESGVEEAQEASYIDFIHSAGAIAPIDAYVGQWMLQGVIDNKVTNLPLTIAKWKEEGFLTVKGALPYAGYDDTFLLQYDPVSGYVILPSQEVAPLTATEGVSTLVVPCNMDEGALSVEETITGKLDEYGGLSFYNTYGNEGNWNTFAYVLNSNSGVQLVSYYSSYFAPYTNATTTRSFVGANNTLPLFKSDMKLVKVEKQLNKKSANLVIKNLNGSWSDKSHKEISRIQLN